MKELIKKIKNKQIIRFIIVGASNTAVSYIAYLIVYFLTENYILSNAAGFVTGTLNAYIWNSRFVFGQDKGKINFLHLFKTFLSYGFTFLINTGLLFVLIDYLRISAVVAPIINAMIIFLLNYVLNKFWVFRRGEKSE